ncbi:MAG: hypothetical protein ACFCVC_19545 [Acidimicrobiia bacterium]
MTPLSTDRLRRFKRAYTTRHVPDSSFVGLTRNGVPESGDVVVARVVEVGQHKKAGDAARAQADDLPR